MSAPEASRFFMRMEGKFADIEDAARRVFAKLVLASAL